MARRGVISDEAVAAAERFRSDFQTAALQALRAAQMRERTGTTLLPQDISFRAERARQRIYEAIQAVGQPGGSCLWHVVGLEESRKRWVTEFPLHPESASGVLIGALGTLEAHYAS